MLTPRQKGDALELAVQAIEGMIIKASPAYQEKTFTIESKKTVRVAGVRHEIDIWVSVDLGAEYAALFIFECKNWETKVGKNHIVNFAEKIRAVRAQGGFFVAKSFTADAETQAALEPRITLRLVADLPASDVPVPLNLHGVTVGQVTVQVVVLMRGANAESQSEPVDPSATLMIGGAETALQPYVSEWVSAERDKCVNSFQSTTAEAGIHDLPFEAERSFGPAEATLDGREIERLHLVGCVQVTVSKPRIISHFEVATRGRALVVALDVGGSETKVAFATRRP
jgi:hypothetical protein